MFLLLRSVLHHCLCLYPFWRHQNCVDLVRPYSLRYLIIQHRRPPSVKCVPVERGRNTFHQSYVDHCIEDVKHATVKFLMHLPGPDHFVRADCTAVKSCVGFTPNDNTRHMVSILRLVVRVHHQPSHSCGDPQRWWNSVAIASPVQYPKTTGLNSAHTD